jgi:2-aminobenzoate-CoA ligase
MSGTAHVDTFAEDRLPPAAAMPEMLLDETYPERFNAAAWLLDRNLSNGNADRRCVVAPGGVLWTYRELAQRVNRIANALLSDYGLQSGHRVLLRGPNTPMMVACWLAVLKAGGIAVTTMPLYRSNELRVIVEKAQVSLALCDERLTDDLTAACEDFGGVTVASFGAGAGLDERMRAHAAAFDPVDTAAEDVALIAFTSGTTGTPKAAMHYHRDILATCNTYGARVLQPRPDDLFCGSAPLGFTFGLGGHVLFPFSVGAATLQLERAGPEELLRAVAEYGATTMFTAPIAYRSMCGMAGRFELASLHTCVSAGETLPKAVWEAWHEATGLKILDGIGSTEMLHIFVGSRSDEVHAGSTGRAVPGYVAEIHDDGGRAVPNGTVGRLAVKGPTGCKYLDDERQADYVRNGWNYPGDAYRKDDDGYLWYVARTDDMIVSAGYNISGPEVEQILVAHVDVKEVAVVAKPHPEKQTHIVKAYVVLDERAEAGDAKVRELQTFCTERIAPFKAPREIEFVSELPRTETGKLQRYKLRRQAAGESMTDSDT